MTDIIITVIRIALIAVALALLVFFIRRLCMLRAILRLRKIPHVSVEINTPMALLSANVTKAPFATVRCRNKIYQVRLFSGGNGFRAVHIANEKYAVVYTKRGGDGMKHTGRGTRRLRRVTEPFRAYGAITKIIPELDTGSGYSRCAIPVLLFCPEPKELTFVTPEKNSIKVAFTGDEIIGHRIFTPDTFASYLDRDSRGYYDS